MTRSKKLRRRRFLQITVTAAAAGTAISCAGRSSPWRFLTAQEGVLLAALAEQVIPGDQDPGAAWAGAVNYIDRQLMGHFRKLQPVYREGLAGLDRACRDAHARGFAELPADQQTAFLEKLGKEQQAFFNMVVDHTMQSYYGDPRHGGNRDGVSWKMLGVPLIPVRGRKNREWTGETRAAGGVTPADSGRQAVEG